jgi:hypothetical protein
VKVPEELQPKTVIMPKLETLQIPKEPLPEMKITKQEPVKEVKPPVQEIKTSEPVAKINTEVLQKTPIRRKSPVKSKSKR